MPILSSDDVQGDEAWPYTSPGDFIYVPLAWRMGQSQFDARPGAEAEIAGALKDLHSAYLDLPVPDRLSDLLRRA